MAGKWRLLLQDSRTRLKLDGLGQPGDVIAERFSRERMYAASSRQKNVLFLCGHNAGRSQMSAAWFNHRIARRSDFDPRLSPWGFSAGSNPSDKINPMARAAMLELGIDMTECFPKPWTVDVLHSCKVVISMGCGDKCPVLPETSE
jgi:arsenate reductase